jgi:CubicO group peptidase (beta-lactamase class C family)
MTAKFHASAVPVLLATTLFAGTLLLSWPAPRSQAADKEAASLDQIRVRMQSFVDQQDIAGAVTVVGRKDAILSYEAVGNARFESQTPMAKDTLFRIASMTKPITAIGIMMLVDESKLSVEDSVEKYLPEFRGQMIIASKEKDSITLKKVSRPITLRDLLTHTSGLPGSYPNALSNMYAARDHSLAESIMAIAQRPLDFEPGSKWSYCNTGIDTLGRILEVVSGQPYEDFLRKRIFEPLGMRDTTFYPTPAQLERVAATYDKKDGKLMLVKNSIIGPPTGAKHPIPAGGLYSTGADLAKLYQLMLNKGTRGNIRFLSEASVAAMTKVQTGDLTCGFTPGMGFGFGFAVVRQPQGVTEMLSPGSFGHGGAFGTQGWIDPEKDLFMVLLIQRAGLTNGDASPMRKELQSLAVAGVKK